MLARRTSVRLAPSHLPDQCSGIRRRVLPGIVAGLFALCHAASGWAFDPFTVRDIRVEGVQRTEAGTIFSYLPIKVGERIDDEKAANAV